MIYNKKANSNFHEIVDYIMIAPLSSWIYKSWSCFIAGQAIPVESFGRIQLWGDLMQIRRVDAQDAGRYICRASNQLGEQRAETHLSVTSKLNARIQPRLQVDFFLT